MVDSDEVLITQDNRKVLARDIYTEDIVFCPKCETEVNKNAGRYGLWTRERGIGTASARTMCNPNGDTVIYCFNCCRLMIVIDCEDQIGFCPTPDEEVEVDPVAKKLNWRKRVDIHFDVPCKLLVIDAPMGSGKTHECELYMKGTRLTNKRILSITLRQALSRTLAFQSHLNCYLDPEFWKKPELRGRAIVCLDSLAEVAFDSNYENYDLVVIDECVSLQSHMLSGTIGTKLPAILKALKKLLLGAEKVIIMQHRIPESTIDMYKELCEVPQRGSCIRRKVLLKTHLHPMVVFTRYNEQLAKIMRHMMSHYLANFDVSSDKCKQPFMVFATRVSTVMFLECCFLRLIEEFIPESTQEVARGRIKAIWSDVQKDGWNSDFLREPNRYASDADVLITTTVLQAGHNVDQHFVTSYDILWGHSLSYREELQFQQIFRYLGRVDMLPAKYAWVEPGRTR